MTFNSFYPLIKTGTYTGDDTPNRPIPHLLSTIPKIVIIRNPTYRVFMLFYNSPASIMQIGADSYAVTPMNSLSFYVGNATEYAQSANFNGVFYCWIAIG